MDMVIVFTNCVKNYLKGCVYSDTEGTSSNILHITVSNNLTQCDAHSTLQDCEHLRV
jgi:hypothetical protein